jgi:hypothetical protein
VKIDLQSGDVISYMEMCRAVGVSLQRGMNFRLLGRESVILMSRCPSAPYADRVEDDGRILIYEGHDIARTKDGPSPKAVDQPERNPSGCLTQNGLFAQAARLYKNGVEEAERVRVYEKILSGIWSYNGLFELVDVRTEESDGGRVFRFELRFVESDTPTRFVAGELKDDDRLIPSVVKLEVWKRDGGQCVKCGATSGLHFDHIIPYSKGGSSKIAANVQILCGQHNLAKRDNIE